MPHYTAETRLTSIPPVVISSHMAPDRYPLNRRSQTVIDSWREMERQGMRNFVTVDDGALDQIAEGNYRNDFSVPSWQFPGVFAQNPAAFASQELLADCFNFAFNIASQPDGKYTVDRGGNLLSGAYAMQSRLNASFGENIVTTDQIAERFSSINSTADFFRGINDIPYPHLRFACAQDFVAGLRARNQQPLDLLRQVQVLDSAGKPVGLRAFTKDQSPGLVDLIVNRFPVAYGADFHTLGDLSFPFAKRAQLTAITLHGRAIATPDPDVPLLPFVDVAAIGPIADYQVPRSLRAMGVLHYSRSLAHKVDNWQEIPSGSQEEIEIRAGMAMACFGLIRGINDRRQEAGLADINITHLDYWLWSKSRDFKGTRPHITQTSDY